MMPSLSIRSLSKLVSVVGAFLALGISADASISISPDTQTISENVASGPTLSVTVSAPGTPVVSVVSSNNAALIPTSNVTLGGSGANWTVSVTPVANQNGSATITLRVNDGLGLGSTDTFTVTVTPVNVAPTVTGSAVASILDTASATAVLSSVTVGDLDHGQPSPTQPSSEEVTVTVTIKPDSLAMGEFETISPGASGGVTVVSSEAGKVEFKGSPPAVTTFLQALKYQPTKNRIPVGAPARQLQINVLAVDGGENAAGSASKDLNIDFTSVNDAPTGSVSTSGLIAYEGTPLSPFGNFMVEDPDEAERVKVAIAVTPAGGGTFNGSLPFTGTPAEVETYVRALTFTPSEGGVVNFLFTVTDVHPDDTEGSGVALPSTPLTVRDTNLAPQIAGVTTSLIRAAEGKALALFPNVSVVDADGDALTVSITFSPLTNGTFPAPFTLTGSSYVYSAPNAADATAKLRALMFTPSTSVGGAVFGFTLKIDDGNGGIATDSRTRIEVSVVDNPPVIGGIPSSNGPDNPLEISPSGDVKPFAGVTIEDDDSPEITVTVSLDDPAKGSFVNMPPLFLPSGSAYLFIGSPTAAQSALRDLIFVKNATFPFPPEAPGGTTFTLVANDGVSVPDTKTLSIVLLSTRRNHLVTKAEDVPLPPAWAAGSTYAMGDQVINEGNVYTRLVAGNESPFNPDPAKWGDAADAEGTLRVALALARENDTITFALPAYPATIRLGEKLVVSKNLNFRGPGADQLVISGDTDGNFTPDTQLFSIQAVVTMEGLGLSYGLADNGGAISVSGNGELTLRRCAVTDSVASLWGGAIDVDQGKLRLEGCLLRGNRTDSVLGRAGGAVSLYTSKDCVFTNCTFARNTQGSASGDGGGALYAEAFSAAEGLEVVVTHCTFAENTDAATAGTSVQANVFGTQVKMRNCIVGDARGGNLETQGASLITSDGGNVSDDQTRVVLTQGGLPQAVFVFNQPSDQTSINPRLGPLGITVGATATYPITASSPAIGTAVATTVATDGRGVLRRDGSPDAGAFEAGSTRRLVLNEIRFATPNPNFLEFYNPRDSQPLDLNNTELWIDGTLVQTFTGLTPIQPGFGLIVATSNTVDGDGTPVVVSGALMLEERGLIEIRRPVGAGGGTLLSVAYNGKFSSALDPSMDYPLADASITLSPQFRGAAYIPHPLVPNGSGDPSSPGKDTGNTKFGANNAAPLAFADTVLIGEDDSKLLDLLANDFDADGADRLFIVDVTGSGTPPDSSGPNDKNATSAKGASVVIEPADNGTPATPHRGTAVRYDPRLATALQELPEGQERVDTFTYSIVDITTGVAESFAASGGKTLVTSPAHRLEDSGLRIRIAGSGAYDGEWLAELIPVPAPGLGFDRDHFLIPATFTVDGTGTWELVEARSSPFTSRDTATVTVTVLGANDPPTPVLDNVETDEDKVLRIMADSSLAGTQTVFDTDPNYPLPRMISGTSLLLNDTDPDTDDAGESLRAVGVVGGVSAIGGFTRPPGSNAVTVSAPGHGLATGDTILISGYGGHPSYNAVHSVTVLGPDRFNIPVPFVDNHMIHGVWARFNPGAQLSATSEREAQVALEIRADHRETNVVYNGRPSAFLDGIPQGVSEFDSFYYAARDRHGALGLAKVSIKVNGVNDAPVPGNDPGTLPSLAPLLGDLLTGNLATLGNALGALDIAYLLPSSDNSPGRANVGVFDPSNPSAGAVELDLLWFTDEQTPLTFNIDPVTSGPNDLLGNDTDVDRGDVLNIGTPGMTYVSREGATVTVSGDGKTLSYDPSASGKLNALARGERIIDTFIVTVNDRYGAGVNSLVAVMVMGLNDTPVTVPDTVFSTREDELLIIGPPGVLFNDIEPDQNASLPDNHKMLVPIKNLTSTVEGVVYSTSVGGATGMVTGFAMDPGNGLRTIVTAPGHALQTGDRVEISETGIAAYEGTFEIVAVNPTLGTFTIGVLFVNASGPTQGKWNAERYASGPVAGFRQDPGNPLQTIVTAPNHPLVPGEEVVLRGTGVPAYEGQFVIASSDPLAGTFPGPVAFVNDSALASGEWAAVRSSLIYDPRGSNSDTVVLVPNGLDGLAFGQSYVDTITYQIFDGSFVFAMDDLFKVAADTAGADLDVLANDRNLTGITRRLDLVAVGPTSRGGSVQLATGTAGRSVIRYVPEPNFVGDEVFSYTIEDELGNRDTAQVVVRATVESLNGNLQANDDAFTVALGQTPVLAVLANDNVIPTGAGSLFITDTPDLPAKGTVQMVAGGILYTPNAGASGMDQFTYEISGGGSARAIATVDIEIVDLTDKLFTRDDAFSVLVGSSANALDVLANDNILPGNGLALTVDFTGVPADLPGHGTVALNAAGDGFEYTPAANFVGVDQFRYAASDGYGSTGSALVTVTVGSLVTNNDFFVLSSTATSTPLPVLANDLVLSSPSGTVSIVGIAATANGIPGLNLSLGTLGNLAVVGGEIQFTAAGALDEATFFYTIEDQPTGRRAVGQASVAVIADGVSANSDFFSILLDSGPTDLHVLFNDIAVPQRPLALVSIGTGLDAPDHGGFAQIVNTPDGPRIRYQPAAGFVGEETFTYTITDSTRIDTAKVVVRVGQGDLYANGDAYTVFYAVQVGGVPPTTTARSFSLPVLFNDGVLPDAGEELVITGVGIDETGEPNAPNLQGQVAISEDGTSLIYTPALDTTLLPGDSFTERFTYVISDGTDRRAEAQVLVNVHVRDEARAMETRDDAFTVATDSLGNLLDVLANDGVKPAPASGWTITGVSTPQLYPVDPNPADANDGGIVSVSGAMLRYSPRAGFVGLVSFSYSVSDGLGGTGNADVLVKVGDVRVCDDLYTVLSDSTGNLFDVRANDGVLPEGFPTRPDGSPLPGFTLDSMTPIVPDRGGNAVVVNGQIVYAPLAGFVGTEQFEYWVIDDSDNRYPGNVVVRVEALGTDRAVGTAAITVNGVNDPPVIEGLMEFTITDKQIINPFGGARITDVDDQGREALTLTVELGNLSRGILFHPGGLFTRVGNAYVSTPMSPADATAALRGLQFQPTPDGRVSAGTNEEVTITLSVNDGHVTVTDDNTVVTVQHPPQSKVLPVITATGVDDSMTGAAFGSSVSVSGNTMAVGSWTRDAPGADSGAVYVYQRVTTDGIDRWKQSKIVLAADRAAGARFGSSVALDKDTLVVGASNDAPGGLNLAGSAYVFERNAGGPGNWGQVRKFVVEAPLAAAGDQFGTDVDIDADTIIVGAPYATRGAGDSGMARIYERNKGGTGTWGLLQEIVQSDPIFLDWLGISVAVSGDTLIVGAYGANRQQNAANYDLGAAYIFDRKGPTAAPWQQVKKLERFADPRATRDDYFGWAVDISGDTAIVGSFLLDTAVGAANAGAAFLYERNKNGAGQWGELLELRSPAPATDERLGYSVAIDGGIALVGTDNRSVNTGGFVQCYVRDLGTNQWRFTDTLFPPNRTLRPGFGYSVAVDAQAVAVGAPADSVNLLNRLNAGAVYAAQLQLSNPSAFALFVHAWQAVNFPQMLAGAANESGPWGLEADPDLDSLSNSAEILMGTDPNVADNPDSIRLVPAPGGGVDLLYQRSKSFPVEFAHPVWSTDLIWWSRGGFTETVEADLGSSELIRASLWNAGSQRIFMRVEIGAP